MKECSFIGGPTGEFKFKVEDPIMKYILPGVEGGQFLSHEYARTGPDSFEFVCTKKGGSIAEASGRNLDFVFGLRDQVTALEAENAVLRDTIGVALQVLEMRPPPIYIDIIKAAKSIRETIAALKAHDA